jgi:hypothetical protein
MLIWDSGDSEWYQTPSAGTVADAAAYSSLWVHPETGTVTVTISAEDTLTAVDSYVNTGPEDTSLNAVGSAAADTITIGTYGAGVYEIHVAASLTTAGASRHFKYAGCVTLATPKTITDATNAATIVVTSTGHGLKSGDIVIISGVGGNTAANGDRIVGAPTSDTFELRDLDHAVVAGDGDYTTGGTVDVVCPGSLVIDQSIGITDLSGSARTGYYRLAAGDAVTVYTANVDSADDLTVHQSDLSARRIDQ